MFQAGHAYTGFAVDYVALHCAELSTTEMLPGWDFESVNLDYNTQTLRGVQGQYAQIDSLLPGMGGAMLADSDRPEVAKDNIFGNWGFHRDANTASSPYNAASQHQWRTRRAQVAAST
jgi:hypothetical protein